MSRYLTPSKVGLLTLVSLYTESVIPSAATIPILCFLVSHLLPIDSSQLHTASAISRRSFDVSIESLQQATVTHASGIPGRTVWDLLLNKIWEINSLDAMHTFFDELSLLLEKPREEQGVTDIHAVKSGHMHLSRVSPLGAFVRRSQLEFTRLQFHDGIELWKSFITYRSPTLAQWRRRHPGIGDNIDINLLEAAGEPTERIRDTIYREPMTENEKRAGVSTEDVEKLLEYQVDHMQSMGSASTLARLVQPLIV